MGLRGPKPGFKKAKQAAAAAATQAAVTETSVQQREPITSGGGGMFIQEGLDPQREEIYKEYFRSENQTVEDSTDSSDEVNTAETTTAEQQFQEETPEQTQEASAQEEDQQREETETEPAPVEAKKEVKTVPLEALHEEREKRKAAQRQLREMQGQIAYMQRLQQVRPQQPETAETEVFDYDRELITLKKQNAEIARQMQAMQYASMSDRQAREMQIIQSQIAMTAQDLEKEGYPAFMEMQDLVASEMRRLYVEDPEAVNEYPDNPSGWKKAFKEIVFPKLQKIGLGVAKEQDFEKKKALKQQAGLTGTTGKGAMPTVTTEKKDLSNDERVKEYMKLRGIQT